MRIIVSCSSPGFTFRDDKHGLGVVLITAIFQPLVCFKEALYRQRWEALLKKYCVSTESVGWH